MALASARRRRASKFMAAFRGRVGLPARLAVRPQSPLSSGARHRTRAARSVPRPRAYSRPRGDRQVRPRLCRVVTGAASSISRLVVASTRHGRRRDGCARSDGVRDTVLIIIESSCPPVDRDCTHWLRGLVCVARSFRSRARRGCNPQNPTAVLPCFGQRDRPLPTRAATIRCGWLLRARPRRFRLSSTIKLVELAFCCDRVCAQ